MKNQIKKTSTILSSLEKANKEFTTTWNDSQKNIQDIQEIQEIQNQFQACAQDYADIIKDIEKIPNWKNSNLLQFYNLEAWFGQIQSQLNGLPQNPHNKVSLLNNNNKIEALNESLELLDSTAEIFKIYVNSETNDSKLHKNLVMTVSL